MFELDIEMLKEQGLQLVDSAKKTAQDLADKGKNKLDLLNQQARLSKAQRQLAAQVGLCKPRALCHLLPKFHLALAAQKYRRKVGGCQPQRKACPESCIWALGGLTGTKHQTHTARASGRRAGMPH